MRNALFFVSKPLELLGAIEAKKQFELDRCILVYSCKEGIDKKTIEYLIEKSPIWDEVTFIRKKPYYGYFWIKLLKHLQKEKFRYLFTRAFAESSYFIHNLNYEELVLLDDGSATINISNDFKRDTNLTTRFSLFKGINKKGVKYDFISWLYSLNGISVEKEVSKVSFFTFYNLPPVNNQTIYKNKMEWLNSLKSGKNVNTIDHQVFIVGTNVLDEHILMEPDYIETLLKMKAYYPDKEMVYIPHYNETESVLNTLAKEGFIIKHNTFNIELDFLISNQIPTYVAGSISTALMTLKLIYGESSNVDFFTFNREKILPNQRDVIELIYSYQDQYINKIELKY